MLLVAALAVAALPAAAAEVVEGENMNGNYSYWRTPGAPDGVSFPTNFMSYPGGVESFDAYHGPINSTYSQVWWTASNDSLPEEIIARFKGKVMRKGDKDPYGKMLDVDTSVPINMAYNHHHNTLITGSGSKMEVVSRHDPRVTQAQSRKHARMSDPDMVWLPVEHTPSLHGVPTSAMFDDGNGGEFRKTLHMYGPPFAQLVESPDRINGIAMQIDTWHRDKMNLTGSPFVPGPVPRASQAPTAGPDAIYSGLLECPLTSRITKTFESGSDGFHDGIVAQAFACPHDSDSFCVRQGVNGINGQVPSPGAPGAGLYYLGKVPSADSCEQACANSTACMAFTWVSPSFGQGWQNMCYLVYSGKASNVAQAGIVTGWKSGAAGAPADCVLSHRQCQHAVANSTTCFAAAGALPGLLALASNITMRQVTSAGLPPGCSVVVDTARAAQLIWNINASSDACSAVNNRTDLIGRQTLFSSNTSAGVTLDLVAQGSNHTATITLHGPPDVWFGVGFGTQLMSDKPYTIVVDGSGSVSERKLDDHAPGQPLQPSVAVLSNTVSSGVRTVVLQRPLKGATSNHFSFVTTNLSLPFISAIGPSAVFGPHGSSPHGAGILNLWPTSGPISICNISSRPFGQGVGTLKYVPTGTTVGFPANRCDPQPRSDLLAQRNPTCDVRTYVGGLNVCRHGWHLLDADQEVPWGDTQLVYWKKFRVYFQEYDPAHHKKIQRVDWCIGSHQGCEYDIPKCAPGTPTAECTHTVTGTWTPVAKGGQDVYLASIHHHCHAPTCLYMESWRTDTDPPQLLCRTQAVYGGTGGYVKDRGEQFNEPGYIANPPCMWGRPEDGLAPPVRMNGVPVFVKSVTNSTYGHYGDMAISQAMLHFGPMNSTSL
eukprot:gene2443-3214_t